MPDTVNHPKHYNAHPSGIECIDVVEHMNFNVGNAMKYLWRSDHKAGIEDLRKAVWYINREIERLVSKPAEVNYPYAHEDCPGRPFIGADGNPGCSLCGVAHAGIKEGSLWWWCSSCQGFIAPDFLDLGSQVHKSCGRPVSLMPIPAGKKEIAR